MISTETLMRRFNAMKTERQPYDTYYKVLADHFMPYGGRFDDETEYKFQPPNKDIINQIGWDAVDIFKAGMRSGVTSQAREWFQLTTSNFALMSNMRVKFWIEQVEEVLRFIISQSNLYQALDTVYGELSAFGTACLLLVPHPVNGIRAIPLTVGQYYLIFDDEDQLIRFGRRFQITVENAAKKWGEENLSVSARHSLEKAPETKITVIHLIEQNEDYDPNSPSNKHMAFRSVYHEEGTGRGNNHLSVSGFNDMPVIAPRWMTRAGSNYGEWCPGIKALHANKRAQNLEKKKAQIIDKRVSPPLKAPNSVKTKGINGLPGGVTYFDETRATNTIGPMYEVNISPQEVQVEIREYEERIRTAFHVDLFQMLAGMDRANITAFEIAKREQEKLMQLEPIFSRLDTELLDPIIALTFKHAYEQGMIPEPPEELRNMDIKVDYISTMAESRKLAKLATVQEYIGFAANVAAATGDESLRIHIDGRKALEFGRDASNVPVGLLKDLEQVQAEVQGQAAQQQQMQQMQMMGEAAKTAETLSKADTSGGNALSDLMEGMSE
jgi:hypothetical protein